MLKLGILGSLKGDHLVTIISSLNVVQNRLFFLMNPKLNCLTLFFLCRAATGMLASKFSSNFSLSSMLPNCWFKSFFLFVLMFVKCYPLLVEGNPYDSPKYSGDSIK